MVPEAAMVADALERMSERAEVACRGSSSEGTSHDSTRETGRLIALNGYVATSMLRAVAAGPADPEGDARAWSYALGTARALEYFGTTCGAIWPRECAASPADSSAERHCPAQRDLNEVVAPAVAALRSAGECQAADVLTTWLSTEIGQVSCSLPRARNTPAGCVCVGRAADIIPPVPVVYGLVYGTWPQWELGLLHSGGCVMGEPRSECPAYCAAVRAAPTSARPWEQAVQTERIGTRRLEGRFVTTDPITSDALDRLMEAIVGPASGCSGVEYPGPVAPPEHTMGAELVGTRWIPFRWTALDRCLAAALVSAWPNERRVEAFVVASVETPNAEP